MFNNPLINEEAMQKIAEREREVETYRLHQQLGYSDRGTARWTIAFLVLAAAVAFIFLF